MDKKEILRFPPIPKYMKPRLIFHSDEDYYTMIATSEGAVFWIGWDGASSSFNWIRSRGMASEVEFSKT